MSARLNSFPKGQLIEKKFRWNWGLISFYYLARNTIGANVNLLAELYNTTRISKTNWTTSTEVSFVTSFETDNCY